ncbi:MAG: hypothetical protein L6R37_004749 [Teloschistes peruensis]|nr:MAG: hypothetical protein L6R37_004749 [Teloschistes peruensis]
MASSSSSNIENGNVFEDLSGISGTSSENPYDTLIEACNDDPGKIQARYGRHRETRNAAQKAKFLAHDFSGVIIDPILYKLMNPQEHPNFVDSRNCLVFWARPPVGLKGLIADLQKQLLNVAPSEKIKPEKSPEINAIVGQMLASIPQITDYPYQHRARLIKPMLSYDTAAIALSFEPAAGESLPKGRSPTADVYTYHHLRRDLHRLSKETGIEVASRYVVPSSHLTIARFVTQTDVVKSEDDHTPDPAKVQRLTECIEEINANLREQYWPHNGKDIKDGGQWIVGEEKGLDCRKGTLWSTSPKPAAPTARAKTARNTPSTKSHSTKPEKFVPLFPLLCPPPLHPPPKPTPTQATPAHIANKQTTIQASLFAQGKRRYDRKQSGYGGQTKPVFHKKAKTTKKVVLRLECTVCKTKAQLALKRCKHFELGYVSQCNALRVDYVITDGEPFLVVIRRRRGRRWCFSFEGGSFIQEELGDVNLVRHESNRLKPQSYHTPYTGSVPLPKYPVHSLHKIHAKNTATHSSLPTTLQIFP